MRMRKLGMDAESIAKREMKEARKAAKESLAAYVAEEKEKYESEQAWLRESFGGPSTRSLSSRQQPTSQAATASSSAAASSSAVAASAAAPAVAPAAAVPKLTLHSFFAKKPA